ncbi:MAG: putative glycoside hydrolase [Sphingomicrobium sp.]
MTLHDIGGSRPVEAAAITSPAGAVAVRPVDLTAQEDALAIRWNGTGGVTIDGPNADLSRQLNNAFALRLDGRVDSLGPGPIAIGIANTRLDASAMLRALPQGRAVTLKIPLRCFADAGAKLSEAGNALVIDGSAGLGLTLQSARVEAVGEPLACPPLLP